MAARKGSYRVGGWVVVAKGDTAYRCPRCNEISVVPWEDWYKVWVDGRHWLCPNCNSHVTVEELRSGQVML